MANGLLNNIKAGLLSGGNIAAGPQKNTPSEYADRQKQYFAEETDLFVSQYSKYASDYQEAELQYWDANGNEAWETVTVRFANVVTPTAAITRHFDDYKNVMFDQRRLDYVRPGVKLRTMGSTWLAINPDNISSSVANSIFRRCNAVWNHLDYYGNIVSEPIIVENARANASAPDTQIDQEISTGYYNVTCQYNDFTRQINDNTRIVLGDAGSPYENAKAYRVTGYGNFFREFTDDNTSTRLLSFSIRVQSKNSDTDDLVNCVADGKDFSWNIQIIGPEQIAYGDSAVLQAVSMRNGSSVTGTAENPVSYIWTSSDTGVLTVNQNGEITAVAEGTAPITVMLAQNPEIKKTMNITVSIASPAPFVRFTSAVPPVMGPMDSAIIGAVYVDENGKSVPNVVSWSAAGARAGSYSANANGAALSVTCFGYSETPLTITASYAGKSVSAQIRLEDV